MVVFFGGIGMVPMIWVIGLITPKIAELAIINPFGFESYPLDNTVVLVWTVVVGVVSVTIGEGVMVLLDDTVVLGCMETGGTGV